MKLKKKLSCILLVDDDEATNYIHTMIITQADCANTVKSVMSGFEALEYLNAEEDGEYPQPEFIFLDINMPGMSGWEFLEEYDKLPEEKRGDIVIVMLTTSLNPDDAEKAKNIQIIRGFQNKPLSVEMMHGLMKEHFPDYL